MSGFYVFIYRAKGQGARVNSKIGGGKMAVGFMKLLAWQKGYDLSLAIYKSTNKFPKSELYGLTSQLRRASISVPANIAEGYERQYRKEYMQFLMIAKGSLAEVETYILFSRDLGYINNSEFVDLDMKRQELGRILKGLIYSLRS